MDGRTYKHGNATEVEFSMQSTAKVVTYALALEQLGTEEVLKYVGVEPSGARFNAFTLTDEKTPVFFLFNFFLKERKFNNFILLISIILLLILERL